MLTVTDRAAGMIRDLVSDADLPAGAGLRLAQRDDGTALAMALAHGAGPEDTTIDTHDVPVFLGPLAARRVADQVLDGRRDEASASFWLHD